MFKAAYPWATTEEELTERTHHKNLAKADRHEFAGSVWIPADTALKLGDEYNMRAWIIALLDPEPIEVGKQDSSKKVKPEISTPPKFDLPKKYALEPMHGTNSVKGSRKRELRSASPSKTPSARKIASPRKRTAKKSDADTAGAAGSSKELNKALDNGTVGTASTEPESAASEKVRVVVDESVEQVGDVETTNTTVRIEMPAGSPDLPLPDSAEEMIEKAKAMVEEAKKTEGEGVRPRSSKGKRKAAAIDADVNGETALAVQSSKRTKVEMEEELKKKKVMNRALIGISATLAVG